MAWRLRRQHLDRRIARMKVVEVAARLCGLHAQVMSSADLALWARLQGFAPDALARALWEDRVLIKTWSMRGTLHLLPAAEYSMWQAALGTYRHYLKPSWFRYFGVTEMQLERLLGAVAEALDGPPLTREELAKEVSRLTRSRALGEKLRESWGALLKPAAFRGHLCFAPGDGQKVRFTRPDRWLSDLEPVDPDYALQEVTRRFLAAHGPTTREDFARWWAMTPAAAKRSIESLGDDVTEVDAEGSPMWMLAEHLSEAKRASSKGSVRLLPAFDHYVVGATAHAQHLLPGDFRARVYRNQGWLSAVLLVDGRMDGIWKHEKKGQRLVVSIQPFVKVTPKLRRAAEEEAHRLANFAGGEPEVIWSE